MAECRPHRGRRVYAAQFDPARSASPVPAAMTPGKIEPGAGRHDPIALSEIPDGVPIRDELMRRWARVLIDQHGADTPAYIQECRRACALRGDSSGADDWTYAGTIVIELMGLATTPGEDSRLEPISRAGAADGLKRVVDDDVAPPIRSEWTFWLILSVLAGGILMLLEIARRV